MSKLMKAPISRGPAQDRPGAAPLAPRSSAQELVGKDLRRQSTDTFTERLSRGRGPFGAHVAEAGRCVRPDGLFCRLVVQDLEVALQERVGLLGAHDSLSPGGRSWSRYPEDASSCGASSPGPREFAPATNCAAIEVTLAFTGPATMARGERRRGKARPTGPGSARLPCPPGIPGGGGRLRGGVPGKAARPRSGTAGP